MQKSGIVPTFFTDSVYGQADKNNKYHFLLYHTYWSTSVLKPIFSTTQKHHKENMMQCFETAFENIPVTI